jgi:hypothetical protein
MPLGFCEQLLTFLPEETGLNLPLAVFFKAAK